MKKKTVVIVGAGPAGLVAAYELLREPDRYEVIVFEETGEIGGISRTVNYKGNRMDIGGHRFFSEIPEVNEWWKEMMPVQGRLAYDDLILKRECNLKSGGPDPEKEDLVMLRRKRLSRIYFGGKFYDYPITMKMKTLRNFGMMTAAKVGVSYIKARMQKREEKTLEDFYINRFGEKLYEIFFEYYTENLWGRHPREISPEWGAERVKGVSVSEVLKNAFSKTFKKKRKTERSLIEEFMYPKLGPGQMWEIVAEKIREKGGKIVLNKKVVRVVKEKNNRITGVVYEELNETFGDKNGDQRKKQKRTRQIKADVVISSMAMKDLVMGMNGVPEKYKKIAMGLPYRDYITIGVLREKESLALKNKTVTKTLGNIIPDNWIYVQDRNVKMGRIQVYNNWSPYLIKRPEETVFLGLEYFCTEKDELWKKMDADLLEMATQELMDIGVVRLGFKVMDYHVVRVKKAYPAYFDTYKEINTLRDYLDGILGLYLVGRNGQHQYNNMDHSMETAFEAVQKIKRGESGSPWRNSR